MTATVDSIGAALRHAKLLGVDRLDAQLLLGHLLGRSRSWLLAHDDAMLDREQAAALEAVFVRCAAGEPLAYLVGSKEFHGLALEVGPAVLVPRPDTELVVDWAIEQLTALPPAACAEPRVADLGTGSGAIALALKRSVPRARLLAADCSAAALGVAARNAATHGLEVEFVESDWWQQLGGRRFELIVSNPPYVAAGDPHLDALAHEPSGALVSGIDGLDALRRIIAGAPLHLVPGGTLLVEHGYQQGSAVRALLVAAGYAQVETRRDLGGNERCSGGRWPGADL